MKNEIEQILKEIKNKNNELYMEIFTVSGLKGNCKYDYYTKKEDGSKIDNKNLAILGDTVLKLIFTKFLYGKKVSNLTEERVKMESNSKFSKIVDELELDKYWNILFPEHKYNYVDSEKATLFEATIGGIYIYKDFKYIEKIILKYIDYFTKN